MRTADWEAMAERLQRVLPRCTVERYDGIHHINTSHQAEPRRVAAALDRLWYDAERPEHFDVGLPVACADRRATLTSTATSGCRGRCVRAIEATTLDLKTHEPCRPPVPLGDRRSGLSSRPTSVKRYIDTHNV